MTIRRTKIKIDPCWANQKPSWKPPILILSNVSENIIPAPKEERNQMIKRDETIFKFDFQ